MPIYLIAAWMLLALSLIGYGMLKRMDYLRMIGDAARRNLAICSGASLAIAAANLPWTNNLIQALCLLLLSSFFTWLLLYEGKIAGLDMWLTWKLIVPIDNLWNESRKSKELKESRKYAKQAQFKAKTLHLFLPLLELLPCTNNLRFHAPLRLHWDGCDVLFNPDP